MQGSVGDKIFSFVITRELAVHDGHGAQVFVVNGNLVAKIFDPLYYPALDDYTGRRADVAQMADCDYSREAAVCEGIRELWGTAAANYHGSWTFNIPTDTASGVVTRSIRLVLIEFIDGVCMRDLEPNQLTEEQRSNIMIKVIEAETAFTFRGGVRHRDFAPRNIICSGGDLDSPQLRVTIIDFNIAVIFRLTGGPRMEGNLPPSPIEHWSRRSVEVVDPGWIPRNRAEWGQWLFKHFGGSVLYQPVTDTAFFDPPRSIPG